LVEIAESHDIEGMVWAGLSKIGLERQLPPLVSDRLRNGYVGTLGRNLILQHELRRLLLAFQDIGIEAVILKGAALMEEIYGDIALRPMGDIDLLVHSEDLQRAGEQLVALGYTPLEIEPNRRWGPANHPHLPPYINQALSVWVEVHWDLVGQYNPFVRTLPHVWENLRTRKIAGVEALVLSPEDQLLHLSVHAFPAQHSLSLRRICDFAKAVHTYRHQVDWGRLLHTARETKTEGALCYALYFSEQVFGPLAPPSVLAELKQSLTPRQRRWLDNRGIDYIFSYEHSYLRTRLFLLFWLRNLRAQLHLLHHILFPSIEQIEEFHATSGWFRVRPLFYLTRPLMLLSRYGRDLVKWAVHTRPSSRNIKLKIQLTKSE